MGIAALVLGSISILIAIFFPAYGLIGVATGIIGIILGAVAKKKGEGGIATAGLVLAIIGTALAMLFYLACVACLIGAESFITSL